ncbi:dienelactone hydrolase family protein [Sulfuriflexus sp.]|uniref:dienelactone hydrolase family protein n=1 Tax=Sulfuriflexus sp. TaxID=2015443 RepID=UPI0028CEE948|nr:alpha/beta family hydrolase [Sulfuriflexus sp.]MDT8404733.1 alpha/beta family hydrolase [Sulfuriflexus sp.]
MNNSPHASEITIQGGDVELPGNLVMPENASGIVVFAHGSGSSRFSPRNRAVAGFLNDGGLATLLFDLLTAEEHEIDMQSRALRFDIGRLSQRLVKTVDWLTAGEKTRGLRIGLFGASTGAAAALIAAAERPEYVAAVVSRGGRPDLAGQALARVKAPTLLIVGGLDEAVIEMNRAASEQMQNNPELEIVPGATHLFEEPGKLDEVARLSRDWFQRFIG